MGILINYFKYVFSSVRLKLDQNQLIICLPLHRVLARSQKAFDAQMLLDPLEKLLHLPAALIQRDDGQWRQRRVVGQKHQR
jgi:hypothetical protein